MNGLKVLHVISSLAPSTGGPAHAIVGMCQALMAEGADITIATTTAFLQQPFSAGEIVSHHGVPAVFFPCELPPHLALSLGLRKWLKLHAGEFAVVHVHGVFTYPCTVACRMAEQNHVPYIVRPLGGLSGYSLSRHALRKSFYLAAWERHNLNHAAALHFTAPAEAAEARGLGLRSPSIVVPLGVAAPAPVGDAEVAAFRERYRTAGRLSLLFLGRLDPKKGLELLFRVLAESADRLPPWRLLVAGSGTPAYAESLQQVVVRAGLGSRVEFVGEIQGREKWTAFRASDLFLLTSRHENFAVAAAEAMRCGVPVIVSNQVGIAPYVEEQRCGLSVSLDSSELAAAIQCLAVDPGLRREMGANGRELASRMFDWPLIAQKLIGIYKELRPQPHS